MRTVAGVAFGAVLLSSAVTAGAASLEPGGLVLDLAADPIRADRLYALTDRHELVVIDPTVPEVSARVPLPGAQGRCLAVQADGSQVWVGLAGAVVAVDVATLTPAAPTSLSSPDLVTDMVLGPRDRLYAATQDDGVAVVRADTRTELRLVGLSTYNSVLALDPAGQVLHVLNRGLSPASLLAYDARNDQLPYLGEDCCHGCIGSSGAEIVVSPDGTRLYLATGTPSHVQVLDAVGHFNELSSILTGRYPSSLAFSRDGSRVFVSHRDDSLLVADVASGLSFHREPVEGELSGGVCVAADDSWVAAIRANASRLSTYVEILPRASLEQASLGSVSVRAVDPVTGQPVWARLISPGLVPGSASAWRDVRGGSASWGPAPPGDYELELTTAGDHEVETLTVTVQAGEWADLGDVVLTRVGADHPAPREACVSPPLESGRRMDVWIHGMNYVDDADLDVDLGAEVQVHSVTWEDWATLRVNATADPSIRPGRHGYASRVTNPDGQSSRGSFLVGGWPETNPGVDRIPPEEVQLLFVRKRPDGLPGYLFEWTEVTLQVDGTAETMGDYQLRKGLLRDHSDAGDWIETEALSYTWSPPPDGSLPSFVTFKVRARDAAGNVGN